MIYLNKSKLIYAIFIVLHINLNETKNEFATKSLHAGQEADPTTGAIMTLFIRPLHTFNPLPSTYWIRIPRTGNQEELL